MKKFLALILCVHILILPALADYDFSDEAQAEFDRQREILLNSSDFSKEKKKNVIKTNEDRTHYLPDNENSSNLVMPEMWYPSPVSGDGSNHQLCGSVVKIPAGTTFDVTFDSGISSGSVAKDDRLTVRLTEDFIYNGTLVAPAGSLVYGSAVDAQNAGYAYGSGAMEINFNEILTPDGNLIKIATKRIILRAKNERAVKMSRDIVVGTLGSLLIGAAFTALGGSHDWGKNMLIYGSIGAAGGAIHGAMQRGEEIQIPNGITIKVTLIDTLNVNPYNNSY